MDGDSPTSLASAFQYLTTPSEKKFFLISNLNLPWQNLRPLLLILSLLPECQTTTVGEEADPHLTTTSFQVVPLQVFLNTSGLQSLILCHH